MFHLSTIYQVFESQCKMIKFGLYELPQLEMFNPVPDSPSLVQQSTLVQTSAWWKRMRLSSALSAWFLFLKEYNRQLHEWSKVIYEATLSNSTPTSVHIADGVKSVDATANHAVLSVQHPVPSSTPILVPGFLIGRLREVLSIILNCSPSLRPRSELHAEFDEAAH